MTRIVGVAVLVLLGISLALWPVFTLVLVLVAAILVLAIRLPEYAFVCALLLFGIEGSVKILLTENGTPLPASGRAVGAFFLDLALVSSVTALLLHDRGRALRRTWAALGSLGRASLVLLGAWLTSSLLQIPQGGEATQAIAGLRLTHGYVIAFLGGLLVLSRRPTRRILATFAAGLVVIGLYAGARAIIGPSDSERAYALARGGVTEFERGEIFRTIGSFSGAVGLASYLTPAAVFCFGLCFLGRRYRALTFVAFACAVAGLVGSYVRIGVVALGIGLILVAALALPGRAFARRQKALVAVASVAALAVVGGATAAASSVSTETRARAGGLVRPTSDPSVQLRRATWRESAREIRDHPLGTGLGTVGHATSAGGGPTVTTDNSYLKVVREQGVIVGLLFLLGLLGLCATVLRRLFRAPPGPRAVATAAFAAALAFGVLALAGEYIEQPGKVLAWTLLGISVWAAFQAPEAA